MSQNAYTKESLKALDKEQLISAVLSLQEDLSLREEEVALLRQRLFGRKTESKLLEEETEQVKMFNDIEAVADSSQANEPDEPDVEEVLLVKKKKKKGKRKDFLDDFPVTVVNHTMTEEELHEAFNGMAYTRLPDSVYRKLEVKPAEYMVYEHHLAVYKCNATGKIVKTAHPDEMLNNSIATPSILAGIMNAKYAYGMPLNRIDQALVAGGVRLGRQNMAHWCIQCAERYLSLIYDRMHSILCEHSVIQADETPVLVTKDGRPAGSKSYMWVYQTSELSEGPPVILYDYEKTRSSERPREFLKGFRGTVMCDGFSGYEALAKQEANIKIANCMAHARREFADIVKALPETNASRSSAASEAVRQFKTIYQKEGELKDLPALERQKRRQKEIKPLLDAYFVWAEETLENAAPSSKLGKALQYSLSRKEPLMRFLSNGEIPIDNSASERSIRPFTIARKNFVMIDTIHGANASAMIFGLVETAKANGLNVYEYLKYLLTEIPKHMRKKDLSFVEDLLPWAPTIQKNCKL